VKGIDSVTFQTVRLHISSVLLTSPDALSFRIIGRQLQNLNSRQYLSPETNL